MKAWPGRGPDSGASGRKHDLGELKSAFGSESPLPGLLAEITKRTNQVNRQLKQVRGESKEALKIVAETGNELNAAKANVTSWNRRVAVLEKIIESTPSIKEALEQVESPDDFREKVEAYMALNNVGRAKVPTWMRTATARPRSNRRNQEDAQRQFHFARSDGVAKSLRACAPCLTRRLGLVVTAARQGPGRS
jgi:hypothetical protein